MTRFVVRAYLLAILTLTVGCATNRPPVVIPPPVTHADLEVEVRGNGGPLALATIIVHDSEGNGTLTLSADDMGRTTFHNLIVRSFGVCASAEGFVEKCEGITLPLGRRLLFDLERVQQPPPPPPASLPWVGQARLEPGGGFVDATGRPLKIVLLHAGDFLSRWTRGQQTAVMADLADIKRAGYDGIRFWTTLGEINGGSGGGFWAGRAVGPEWTPQYWDHFEAFLQAVRDAGLAAKISQGDVRRIAIRDRIDFVRQQAARIGRVGPDGVFMWEAANESRDTGEGNDVEASSASLAMFARAFKEFRPEPLIGLSSFTGTEDVAILNAFSRSPADLFIVHSYRGGRWWDKIRHVFSLRYEGKPAKRVGDQGEPAGYGVLVSAIDNKHELDEDWYVLQGAMSLMTRQSYTVFYGPGVISDCAAGEVVGNNPPCDGKRLQDMPGFWTVAQKIKASLPDDIMRYDNGDNTFFHSGDNKAHLRIFVAEGENRADCAKHHDGRIACILYGEHPNLRRDESKAFEIFGDTQNSKGRIVFGRVH